MVGSSVTRKLRKLGFQNLLTPAHTELELTDQAATRRFLQRERPDLVLIAAARVGGIWANMTYPANFLYENLMIACNLIHESHSADVPRLLYLGSTCIYPKLAPQPIPESALLTGPLEPTNEAYALAKISGIKLCEHYSKQYGRSYTSAMPTNLYGPGDSYDLENSHVIPALMRRFHEAKVQGLPEVVLWGSGTPRREFLYVEDLAEALCFLLDHHQEPSHINVGSEEEVTIRELAEKVAAVVGYKGKLVNDLSKPDGTPRKKTDLTKIYALGWRPTTTLDAGLKATYEDFLCVAASPMS